MTTTNEERNALIVKLYREKPHLSNNDIAKEVGCTRAIVSGVLFREREKGALSRNGLRRSPRQGGRIAPHKARMDPLPSSSPERSKQLIDAVMALKAWHCRWPLEVHGHFMFCPETKSGETYCAFHERVARYGMKGVISDGE